MKFCCIVLIVLIFVIQILTGTGYGICECLNSIQSSQTEETTSEHQWVEYSFDLINNTKLVEFGRNERYYYIVTRLIYDDGNIIPWSGGIQIDGKDFTLPAVEIDEIQNITYTKKEVLLAEPDYYRWINSSNGIVESNAIEGGSLIKMGEKLFICRIKEGKAYWGGWMQPSNHFCYDSFGQEYHQNYELLVKKV